MQVLRSSASVLGKRGLGNHRLCHESADAGFNRFIFDAFKCLEQRFQNDLSTVARHGHADLLANRFLAAAEDEVIREGLQASPFSIRKRAGFLPVIDVRAAPARAGDRVGGLGGIKTTIDLREACSLDVEAEFGRQETGFFGLPYVHAFGNEVESSLDGFALSGPFLICGSGRNIGQRLRAGLGNAGGFGNLEFKTEVS